MQILVCKIPYDSVTFPHISKELIKVVLLQKDLFIVAICLAWPLEISPELETLLNKLFTLNFLREARREQ